MELMTADTNVLSFLHDFQAATRQQLRTLCDCSKRSIDRLLKARKIIIEDNIVKLKDTTLTEDELKGVVGVLEILVNLHKEKEIKKVVRMDLPFIAAGQTNDDFYYFTYIKLGEEKLQTKILNHENRGNIAVVLEEKKQLVTINKYMEKPISKFYWLNE